MLTEQEKPANSAEASVIGSMLIEPRCVPELMQELTAEDFTDATLRLYFEAIRRNFLQRIPLDIVTVLSSLGLSVEAQNRHAEKMVAIMANTPTAANCMAYARIIKERRQLLEIQEACRAVATKSATLEDARDLLTKAAGLLVQKQANRDRDYGELFADFVGRQDNTPPDYLDWGIPALNGKLHAGPGRFIILGADSSVGKTALALQFALNISQRKRVGFFSYETTLADATDRLIANDADVVLLLDLTDPDDYESFKKTADEKQREVFLFQRVFTPLYKNLSEIHVVSAKNQTNARTAAKSSGSVIMESTVESATIRLASPESRWYLVANRAQEAATGAPHITASVRVWLSSSHGRASMTAMMTTGCAASRMNAVK